MKHKINGKLIIYFRKIYVFYTKHALCNILLTTYVVLQILTYFMTTKQYLQGIILGFVFYMWKSHFTFPILKRKVVNTVIGPPGSGKTSLAAFIALKSSLKLKKETIYSNCDIIGTRQFDWERDYGTYKMEDCTIIIDESGLDLDNRNFAMNFTDIVDKKTGEIIHNGKSKLISLKYHRHTGQDLWVLSQWTDQDVKIRNLSQNFWVMRKTGIPWLLCCKLYDTDIKVDQMTGDFRFERVKKHTYFIISSLIWYDFNTTSVPFDLPEKEWKVY